MDTVLSLIGTIFQYSYVSLGTFAVWTFALVSFPDVDAPFWKRLSLGTSHACLHLVAAIAGALALELLVEFAVRQGYVLSQSTSHGEWNKIQEEHFPTLTELQAALDGYSLGLASRVHTVFMDILDLPETIAYSRKVICDEVTKNGVLNGTLWLTSTISRGRITAYYLSFFLYFWLVATVSAAQILGGYLCFSLNVLGLHWNEAFSSLQIKDYKNLLRFHITKKGNLEVYSLGVDRVPNRWVQDPSWFRSKQPSHQWAVPSQWIPAKGQNFAVHIIDKFELKSGHTAGTISQPQRPAILKRTATTLKRDLSWD